MMKKVISMLLICAMLLTAGAALAEAPGNQLGFDVLRALTDGTKNQVFSPVSLAYALGMALEGADGATEDEIEKALGTDDLDDWIEHNGSKLTAAGLKLANAAFITGEIQPDADYIEDLKKDFGAEWFEMSGDMADKINQWTKEHTDGLIEKLIDGELDPLSQLVLVNAVAMDAKWSSPFSADETADGIFHAPDGDVTASMMHQTLYADYAETDEALILRLTYSDSGLSMLLALPKDGQSVTGVLDKLSEKGLSYFSFPEEMTEVSLTMPKIDLSAKNTLNDALQALGVRTAFSDSADFSDITTAIPLQIAEVMQKARLVVDEDGTKAAAATEVGICAMSAPLPAVDFTLDRPFVAVIAEEETGTVCFASVIANPAEN